MHEYDKSSKWLIQHHGDAILRLGGVEGIASWRPLQAEVVQPRQLPDGLIEATCRGREGPELFVLELATYPDRRVEEQVLRDAALVYLDRRVVPEVLTVVLRPKGNLRVGGEAEAASPAAGPGGGSAGGSSSCGPSRGRAARRRRRRRHPLGAARRFDGPPGPILRRCRERIDRQAPPDERENLLAVTQVLAGLRYNDPALLQLIFGGERP